MRTSTALLAVALAALLVIPSSLGRPSSSCSSSKSQKSASRAAAESSSSEEEQLQTGNGLYVKRSKDESNKAVSQNAQQSSESAVVVNDGSGSVVQAQKSKKSSSSSAVSSSSSSQEQIIQAGGCGCKSIKKELTEAEIKALYCQKEGESLETYFNRIVAKTEYTSTPDSYLYILNTVRKHYSTLALWYDIKYIDLIKPYYTAIYSQIKNESEELYYSRLIKKEAWENEEQYYKRIVLVRDLYPSLALWTEEKYFEKYTKSLYSVVYKKFATETEEQYIKRIFAKDSFFDTSDLIWCKKIFLIQEATIFSPIWYEAKYFDYLKSFYSVYYKKAEKETTEEWFTRVLKPLPGESFDKSVKRIEYIKKATETCGLWKFSYFTNIYTTKVFQSDYLSLLQKSFFEITESDIKTIYVQKKEESLESYFKRIVTKTEFLSTTESYIKTLDILRKDFNSLDLWYDIKYIDLVKPYYTALYTKTTTESEELYYSRIIKKEAWENEEQYYKRIVLVRDLFPSLALWTEEKYFEKYTKSLYSVVYKKFATETEEQYIKRIFARDSFFDTSDLIWCKKIFLIQEATIFSPIWYEAKYFDYLKSFYSVYYKKAEKETTEEWFTRVLKPLPGEGFDQSVKRIEYIKKATETCGLWKFSYFSNIYTTKVFQSDYLSLLQKSFFEITESDIKTIYVQKKEESLESYFKRIVTKTEFLSTTESYIKTLDILRKDFNSLDLWYDIKYIDLVKPYYTALYTKTTTESEELYYSRIIKKEAWENEEQYYKRIILVRDLFPSLALWTEEKYFEKYTKSLYSVVYKKFATETEEQYIKRIFARDSFFDTSDLIWCKKIFLIQEATIFSPIWYEAKYFDYLKSFYSVYYKKAEKETTEEWFTRVLKPLPGEGFDQSVKRIEYIKKATETCGLWKFSYFTNIYTTKVFQSDYLSLLQESFFEITESDIKTIYTQKKEESLESYFKRIVTKTEFLSTTESYINTLNILRRDFYSLDLWYDIKYIDLVKPYYTALYTKTTTESEELYYSRIIKKEAWENEEQYYKRIVLVRDLFPSLALWTEEKYFEKYTKSLYSVVYKKFATETEEQYIKRIFARDSFFDTSDLIWCKKIFLIQEATIFSPIWYEAKYFDYLKTFYSVYYKKFEKETNEAWLARALKPLSGESFEQAVKRIQFIKKVTDSCGCWKVDIFNLVKATKCFQSEYFSLIEKTFFPTQEVYTSVKSKKSSSSSSSSASSSEEQLKAISGNGAAFEKKSSSSQSAALSQSADESEEAVTVRRGCGC